MYIHLMSVLSNAQVAVILQVSAGVATNRDEELNDIYRKTQQYVNRFNTMNNPEKEHQEVVDELDNLQEYVVGLLCPFPESRPIYIDASILWYNLTFTFLAFFKWSALQTFRVELDDHNDTSHHHHHQQHQHELELHGCEVAALMNLVGTDTMVEEALALIPSLSRFPEAALDEILDLIRNTMIRVVS